jgi:hypothetical protein
MHHPKLLRSKWIRSATIPAALLCLIAAGCAEQHATAPELPLQRAAGISVPFNRFFIAWSQAPRHGQVESQTFSLDAQQERQWSWWADQSVVAFARANPGRLYIVGDEPDQDCMAPGDYAQIYHDFVVGVRAADPTARVSPAGFAEPNYKCCPLPDDVPAPCWSDRHSTGFADGFYNAYVQRYGVAPPVNEWRFHDFALRYQVGDMNGWWSKIDRDAAWSVAHGANMVLGAWGFHGWHESNADQQEHIKQAMGRIMNDPRINGAVYWSYEQWAGELHYLANDDGSLTPEGQTYVNPLTDIPTNVTAVASTDGKAQLGWSNTTSAWAVEAEFWVQAPGTDAFVYKKTQMIAGPGATQTAFDAFTRGDVVKGRVRYYNAFGQAGWSPFSSPVTITSTDPVANPKVTHKGPQFCALLKC